MALLRRFFFRKPPEGLFELCERVYVFDRCFSTEAWEEEDYKAYVAGAVAQLGDHIPDASPLVFNFREGRAESEAGAALSELNITVMDYPRHYEGCPVLKMEVLHHFLRSGESWLSLGPHNVLLMHCERGGWPVLAFVLAALLIYGRQHSGEQRTLDMVYKQAPQELLHLLSPLNPMPSQLRYLQYVSRRNVVTSEWPPADRRLVLDCIILRNEDQAPKVLYSTPKKSRHVRANKQAENELIKIDINCHLQGDVVVECISMNDSMDHEEMMFRFMFNTAFIRSNILILNRDEVDVLWDATDKFSKDFKAEILFSELDATACVITRTISCFEENEGLPEEAFAKVQEIFNHVDWLDDAALNVLQHISALNTEHTPGSPRRSNNDGKAGKDSLQSITTDQSSLAEVKIPNEIDILKSTDPTTRIAGFPESVSASSDVPESTDPENIVVAPLTPQQPETSQPCSVFESSTSSPSHLYTPPPPPPPPPQFFSPTTKLKKTSPTHDTTNAPITSPSPPPPPPPPPMSRGHEATPYKLSSPPPPPPPPPPSISRSHVTAPQSFSSVPPPPPPPPPMSRSHVAAPQNLSSAPPPPPPPPPPPMSRSHVATPPNLSSTPPPPPPPAPGFSSTQPGKKSAPAPPSPPPSAPFSKGAPKTPSSAPTLGSSNSGKGSLSRKLSARSSCKKLKPLHWMKITRAAQGSLWEEAQKYGTISPEIDMSELESLFSALPMAAIGRKSIKRGSVGKSEKVQLIDHRRAYNCEIMLSKVKVPLDVLMSSVLSLEDSALDIDQVDNLIKFCPTQEEMELLKGYTGEKENLGRCEQFFLELIQVPRVESKLRVFSFKIQFTSQVSDLRHSLNVVNSASEEIRNSVKLKRIMQTILSLGNALNQGTARGSAIGFKLDSLLKLTETRARNNKMTLMHYLCKVLAEKLPEVVDFSKDLSNLESAAKIQIKILAEEMQAISKGLEKVVQELSSAHNDGPISENFCKILKEFLLYAEAEVRSLTSVYSAVGKNMDSLILYFGEDVSRCTFEQVISTLLNFTRMFNKAHDENCKEIEREAKKMAKTEKIKIAVPKKTIRGANIQSDLGSNFQTDLSFSPKIAL